jgi:hypothetical protein
VSARRVRIFIDFWNFQLSWNSAMAPVKCDWTALAAGIVGASADLLATVGHLAPLELEETRLYASVDPTSDGNLQGWLTNTIERLPSWTVTIRERKAQPRQVHCRHCGRTTSTCPTCTQPYMTKPEKGVDTPS